MANRVISGEVKNERQDPTRERFEPNILVFACNWCSYAGADLAGVSRVQMLPNCRVVRVMCSGRVSAELVISALSKGIDGVMVLGCHPGECHYSEGNYRVRRRAIAIRQLLPYVGIEPERFRLHWVSASEGRKFAELVENMVKEVRVLGPIGAPRGPRRVDSHAGQASRRAVGR